MRMCAKRVVSTRVLPVPAPANTSSGPSTVTTASSCSAFRPSRWLIMRLSPCSEADIPERRPQCPVKQPANQEAHQRAVHPHVLQILANAQFQPLNDGVGVPVGDHLGDEVCQ